MQPHLPEIGMCGERCQFELKGSRSVYWLRGLRLRHLLDCGIIQRLEDLNRGVGAVRLRNCDEVPIDRRYKPGSPRTGTGSDGPERMIMIRVDLLEDIDLAPSDRIETLTGDVKLQVIDTFGNRQRLKLFAGVAVEDYNLAAAASDEQPLVLFIKPHGHVVFAHSNGPGGDNRILPAIDHHYTVLRAIVQVKARSPHIKRHGFQRVALYTDVCYLLAGSSINHADKRVRIARIFTPVIDIQVAARCIVADRVRVFGERDVADQMVGLAIEDFERAVSTIGYIDAIEILAIENRMRYGNAGDLGGQCAVHRVEDEDRVAILGRGKEPVVFQVDAEVVEVPLYLRPEGDRLQLL